MSSARSTADSRHGLVLLRGGLHPRGLDSSGGLDDGGAAARDWNEFCDRLGWQAPDAEPADDFEDRLASRIFGKELEASSDVISIDRDRDLRLDEVITADFDADEIEPAAPSGVRQRGWRRAAFPVGAAVAVAAAIALLVINALSPKGAPPVASFPEQEDAIRANATPSVELPAPIDPPQAPRITPLKDDGSPAQPIPSETPDAKSPSSGALVARVSPEATPFRRASVSVPRAEAPATDEGAVAKDDTRSRQVAFVPTRSFEFDDAAHQDRPRTLETLTRDRSALPDTHRSDLAPASITVATNDWSTTSDLPSDGSRVASASWALEPGNERWLGVSVTPSAGTALAGGGVMAQLDLGKAFGKL